MRNARIERESYRARNAPDTRATVSVRKLYVSVFGNDMFLFGGDMFLSGHDPSTLSLPPWFTPPSERGASGKDGRGGEEGRGGGGFAPQ